MADIYPKDEASGLLAGAATRNGSTRTTRGARLFRAFASSDVAGTLSVQQSEDGSTWHTTVSQPVAAGATAGTVLESLITLPNVRASYLNGAGAQASFVFWSALVD